MNGVVRVATVITRMQAGAGGVALRGALALDRNRFSPTIIAGSGDRLLERAAAEGLNTIVLPSLVPEISPMDDARAVRALRQLIIRGGYGVVHTHSAKAGTVGRLAAISAGVPVIVHTLHGFPFHRYQSLPRRAAYVGIERFLGQRTSMLLAVGSGVAAEAVSRRIAGPDRIRTIEPAIDPIEVGDRAVARRQARRRLAIPPGMLAVGSVGRLDYQKAPERFVEALAALNRTDVYGIWIGGGTLRAEVERRAQELGLADRFVCLGDRDDVASLLPGLDLFALSSRYEGLPCALVEAMTVGIPVVATAVNAVPDVVVPGETGLLVPPEQPKQLARAIGHLLDHPEQARRMAAAARQLVAGRFTGHALGAVLEEAYGSGAITGRRSRADRMLPRSA